MSHRRRNRHEETTAPHPDDPGIGMRAAHMGSFCYIGGFVTSGDVTNPLVCTAGATSPPDTAATRLKSAISNGGDVRLTEDIEIRETLLVTRDVTLDLNGHVLKMTGDGSVLRVKKDGPDRVTLIITDSRPQNPHGSYADLPAGGVITGGKGPNVTGIYYDYVGGAVFLEKDTTLKLEGGTLTVNSGSSIYIDGATLVMSGGTITGETVGVHNNVGTFTMTGGRITGCYEQGVYMSTGWMEMSEAAYIGGNNTRNNKEDIFIEETLQTSARLSVTGGTIEGNVRIKFWWNSGMTKDKLGEVDTVVQGANVLDGHIKVEIGTSGICVDYNTVNFIDEVANTRTLKLVLQPNAVEEPETPATVNGREFMYWTKEGASEAWDFSTEIKGPLTLYAVRTPASSSGGYYYYPTPDTKADDAKGSPKTADPGVALYAALSLLSLTGLTCITKKR